MKKNKATFNLSEKVLNELEDYWLKCRKKYGNIEMTKTKIVELAVEKFIHDSIFYQDLR